jgi:hypothetical protein
MQDQLTSGTFERRAWAAATEGDASGGGERAGGWWRSHTFMDGTREMILHVRLGPVVAGALHARLCEMTAHGCERVVIDLTAAGPLGAEELGLLAGALAGQPPDCRVAIVTPEPIDASVTLGQHVRVTRSLSAARRELDESRAQERRTPAGPLLPPDRHALAVRQSLRWASLAAAQGDYDTALSWLATVEALTGALPAEWRRRQQAWRRARRPAAAPHAPLERLRGRRANGA